MAHFESNLTSESSEDSVTSVCQTEYKELMEDGSNFVFWTRVFTVIWLISLAIFTIITNGLVIFVITKHRELQCNANILLVFLGITDLFAGLIAEPLYVIYHVKFLNNVLICGVLQWAVFFNYLLSGISLLTVLLITTDRYVALFRPFQYNALITQERLYGSVVLTWSLWFVGSCFLYSKLDTKDSPVGLIISIIIFVVLTYCSIVYGKIYKLVRRHRKRISAQEQSVTLSIAVQDAKDFSRETKKSKNMAILIGFLLLCFMPGGAVMMIDSFMNLQPEVMSLLKILKTGFILLSSAIDPAVYFFRSREIRKAVLSIFKTVQ